MAEVRNRIEGSLSWVQASGSALTWATAATPTSAVNMAFVRNFNATSAQTVQTISDRGTPSHHKVTDKQPIQCTFDLAWANTGQFPAPASGGGATVPMMHLEFKMTAPEGGVGNYYQIHGVPIEQFQLAEGDTENTLSYTCRGLAMVGPTASGYLS